MGYHRAGFEVVGVDCRPQPRYAFEFHQADALTFPLEGFDLIHASPPCQRWSVSAAAAGNKNDPDLLTPTRDRLVRHGAPYIIENVPGAPLLDPVTLDGMMFGLRLIRRRLFESNLYLMTPRPARKPLNQGFPQVYGNSRKKGEARDAWRAAMGIDWMVNRELAQAIPPAYTEFLGRQAIAQLKRAAA